MNTIRIKVCGITRHEDALHAESQGVEALGFVFVAKSRRNVSLSTATDIVKALGPFLTPIALFLEPDKQMVEQVITAIPNIGLQFHGNESAQFCDSFSRPYIKAIGLGSGKPDLQRLQQYEYASAFLFDSNKAGELGGTGHTFDWQLLRSYAGKPLILAGGLQAENVARGIRVVRPYAVDVSSGVELSPGIKSAELITQFIATVRQCECTLPGDSVLREPSSR